MSSVDGIDAEVRAARLRVEPARHLDHRGDESASSSAIRDHRRPPPADDIIATCYASNEFKEGVKAFLEGRKPRWGSE